MRNYSNQNSSSPSNSKPSGNRGNYNRNNGGPNREHRDNRSGGYRGGNRTDRGDHRPPSSTQRPSSFNGPHRSERPAHFERHEGQPHRPGSSWVEVTGRSPEESIAEAAKRFNVNVSELKTEVVEEGSKGFLGIGSKPARVKVALKPHAVGPFAEGVLNRLLSGMTLPDKVKNQKDSDGNTVLNIQGPSSGTLIGRHGHTLEALQYLVSKIVQRVTGDEKNIVIVDVESYLERQKDKLRELAVNLAQKAKETGVEIPMRPMSSKDRRVVHLALKEHAHVTTESRGEGLRRKVVIVPKVKAENVSPEVVAAAQAAGNVEVGSAQPMEDQVPVVETQPEAPAPAPVAESVSAPLEPGNAVPKEPEVDDNIGNRV